MIFILFIDHYYYFLTFLIHQITAHLSRDLHILSSAYIQKIERQFRALKNHKKQWNNLDLSSLPPPETFFERHLTSLSSSSFSSLNGKEQEVEQEKEKEEKKKKEIEKEKEKRELGWAKQRGPLSYFSSLGKEEIIPSHPYSINVTFEENQGEKKKEEGEKEKKTGLALYLHLFLGEDEKNEQLSQDEAFEGVKEYISSKLTAADLLLSPLYSPPSTPLITGEAIKDYFLHLCAETSRGGWGGRGGRGTFLDDLVVFVYTMLPLVLGEGAGVEVEVGKVMERGGFCEHGVGKLPEKLTLAQVFFFFFFLFFFLFPSKTDLKLKPK